MYEELINKLRETSMDFGQLDYVSTLLFEAANAIEDLWKKYLASEVDNTNLTGWLAEEHAKHLWIPVTERLPETERKSYWVCTDTGYQCECRWTNNRFGIGELDEWYWSIFDIPQYQKVMAWMDLPEPYKPPKEKKK